MRVNGSQFHPDPPKEAVALLDALEQRGFEVFFVGGCVRDGLLGREPQDWDISTSALPEEVMDCFAGSHTVVPTGLKHGTVTVYAESAGYEITTYRVDGPYRDYRHPEQVAFTGSLSEDLARRDFTVNAMAWHPRHGLRDYHGGLGDLRAGILRCVGDPATRFGEDALRIFRCARFAAVLGFGIEPATQAAMLEMCGSLRHVAAERLRAELCKALIGEAFAEVFRENSALLVAAIPELAPMLGFLQNNPHHIYNVWEHTLRAVQSADPLLPVRLALLLHDIGKPHTYWVDAQGVGHFYGHAQVSADMAREILKALRFDNATAKLVEQLIRYHSVMLEPRPAAIRRWLHRLGEENLRLLLKVNRGDNRAKAPETVEAAMQRLDRLDALLDEVLAQLPCFTLHDLAVDGWDLMVLGVPKGPEIGAWLNFLLQQVIDGAPNDREAMLARIAEFLLEGKKPSDL